MHNPCHRYAPRGFTLAELLIAMLLVAILAAIALPKWTDALRRRKLAMAAHRIVADIHRAQSAATVSSSSKIITFNTALHQYTISGLSSLETGSALYTVNLAHEPFQCQLNSVFGQTGTQSLTFNGYGETGTSGNIVLSAGSNQKTIVFSAATGRAVVP